MRRRAGASRVTNRLTAAWSGGNIAIASAVAGVAKFNLTLGPLWQLEGALIVVNVVFGIIATCYQDHWDFVKVAKDLGRNIMLLIFSAVAYVLSARGMIPANEAGSPTGDWVATGVVFIFVLQMVQLMKATGIDFGPLSGFIENLSANPPRPQPPPSENLAKGGPLQG